MWIFMRFFNSSCWYGMSKAEKHIVRESSLFIMTWNSLVKYSTENNKDMPNGHHWEQSTQCVFPRGAVDCAYTGKVRGVGMGENDLPWPSSLQIFGVTEQMVNRVVFNTTLKYFQWSEIIERIVIENPDECHAESDSNDKSRGNAMQKAIT